MDNTSLKSVPCTNGTLHSVLDVKVSGIKCYMDGGKPAKINLLEWLETDLFKDQILHLRSLKSKEERDKYKATLPAITPSGLFGEKIAEQNIIAHSGLLAFDIDFKDNKNISNYAELKQQISGISNVAYCGLSASGTGYWGLVKIANPDKHKEHFEALYNAFNRLGIIIDKLPKNVASKRGCSYDPSAYFNHNPTEFYNLVESTNIKNKEKVNEPLTKIYSSSKDTKLNKLNLYLKEIIEKEIDLTESYKKWLAIGCALANEFKEEGRSYFHQVSQFHPKYDKKITDMMFSNCIKKNYPYTMGTFYYYCHEENIGQNKN